MIRSIIKNVAKIYFSVPEHVNQLLLRMPVRGAKGSSRHRSYLGKYVGRIEPW